MIIHIVRDNFDAKKESFEKDISDLLGRPYTININPNAIYAYAGEGYAKERTGKVLAERVAIASPVIVSSTDRCISR